MIQTQPRAALLAERPGDARSTTARASIIIPAYNEEEALPHVLEAILSVVDERYDVLVVNDGSSDATAAVAKRFPCRLISHSINRGKGAAMQTGIQHAYSDKLVFIDGDATYPVDVIPQLVDQLDHYDVVRCVRDQGRDNIPLLNRLGNQFFDQLIRSVHSVDGGDILSGLYGLQRRHLLAMRIESHGFDIETEIMVKAGAMGLTSHLIPIQYHERIGEKKLEPVRDGMRILGRILSLALMFNPFLTYIVPGMALWALALCVLLLLSRGSLPTPLGNLNVHTLIVSAMAFLAGFQLVLLGCVVNLYTAEAGMRRLNGILSALTARPLRIIGFVLGVAMIALGSVWSATLALSWVAQGPGPFIATESLVVALALVVWGIQMVGAIVFLSLFTRYTKPTVAHLLVSEHDAEQDDAEVLLEREAGSTLHS